MCSFHNGVRTQVAGGADVADAMDADDATEIETVGLMVCKRESGVGDDGDGDGNAGAVAAKRFNECACGVDGKCIGVGGDGGDDGDGDDNGGTRTCTPATASTSHAAHAASRACSTVPPTLCRTRSALLVVYRRSRDTRHRCRCAARASSAAKAAGSETAEEEEEEDEKVKDGVGAASECGWFGVPRADSGGGDA